MSNWMCPLRNFDYRTNNSKHAVKSSLINYNFLVRKRIGFFTNFICYTILYFLSNDTNFIGGASL